MKFRRTIRKTLKLAGKPTRMASRHIARHHIVIDGDKALPAAAQLAIGVVIRDTTAVVRGGTELSKSVKIKRKKKR